MVAAILYSGGTSWLPNEYNHRKKIRYHHFLAKITPLPIGHFITLHNNNGLNSKNFEDIEITNK